MAWEEAHAQSVGIAGARRAGMYARKEILPTDVAVGSPPARSRRAGSRRPPLGTDRTAAAWHAVCPRTDERRGAFREDDPRASGTLIGEPRTPEERT